MLISKPSGIRSDLFHQLQAENAREKSRSEDQRLAKQSGSQSEAAKRVELSTPQQSCASCLISRG